LAKQLLIYERAVAVNPQRHANWSVKTGKDYEFVRQVNSVPLTTVEFPLAASEYAIVFAGNEDAVMPSVILGVRDQENLYLSESGAWQSKYVPAFVRRYPFVFASSDGGNKFTLCIDEEFAGCNQEGIGERLFDSQGEKTQYLGSVLEFLRSYQAEFNRTQTFCKKLKKLELLEPMQARFNLPSGQQMALSGFMAISRERLQKLPAEKLSELAQSGELEIAYLHLQSMRNVSKLAERMDSVISPTGDAEESVLKEDSEQMAHDKVQH